MGAGFNLASQQYCLGSLYVTVLRVATVWTLVYPLLESYVILLTALRAHLRRWKPLGDYHDIILAFELILHRAQGRVLDFLAEETLMPSRDIFVLHDYKLPAFGQCVGQ